MNWSKAGRSLCVGLALLCVLTAVGCIVVPVRTKTVIQNPAGLKEPFPKLAIVPGTTTREQVEEQYKSFAVDSGDPNLFWGRFRKSSWAVFVAVGGNGGAAGGGARTWGTYNLLVSFDSRGNVKTFEIVRDKELLDRLVRMYKEHDFSPLDLSQHVSVSGTLNQRSDIFAPAAWQQAHSPGTWWVDLQLSESGLIVTKHKPDRIVRKKPLPQPPEIVTVPFVQIADISVRYTEDVNEIPVTLRFAEKTALGKHVSFNVAPSALLTLVRWQQQVEQGELQAHIGNCVIDHFFL